MRILYICPSIPLPGFHGGSTHVYELSRHLVKLGCKVYVLARRLPGQSPFEIINGINVHRVWRGVFKPVFTDYTNGISGKTRGIGYSIMEWVIENEKLKLFAEKLYFNTIYLAYVSSIALHLARAHEIDIILERGDSYGAGAIVSMLVNKPLITEIRDKYQPYISLTRASVIVTYDKSILRNSLFKSKAITMYGGVDITKFRPISNSRNRLFPSLREKVIIGYSGSFMKSHRINDILLLAKKLYRRYGNRIHFLMIGPYDARTLEFIKHFNLAEIFTFTGIIEHENLPAYLSSMDIGIALYDPERVAGPPYKVYEYMACGLPVITTRTLYSERIIQNGVNGLLIKSSDIEELYSKVIRLIENSDLRGSMGKLARKTVLKYTWEKEAKNLLSVIKKVCEMSK